MQLHPPQDGVVERLGIATPYQLRELREEVRAEDRDERAEYEKEPEGRAERVDVLVRRTESAKEEIPEKPESSSVFVAAFGGDGHSFNLRVDDNLRPCNTFGPGVLHHCTPRAYGRRRGGLKASRPMGGRARATTAGTSRRRG
jgi:hypothetical protein